MRRTYPAVDLARIEQKPESERGQAFLAEDLADAQAAEDQTLVAAAAALTTALLNASPQLPEAVGVDLQQVKAASLRLNDIRADDVAVRVRAGEFRDDIDISTVTAGRISTTERDTTDGRSDQAQRVDFSGNRVGGDVHIGNKVYQTDRAASEIPALRQAYLQRLLLQLDALPLSGIDPKAAAAENESRLRLSAVYTALLTTEMEMDEESPPAGRRRGRRRTAARKRWLTAIEQLNRHPHLVMLGDPGSGKSTFVNFVGLCMAGALRDDPALNLALLTASLPPQPRIDIENTLVLTDEQDEALTAPQPWDHAALLPVRIVLRDFAVRGLPADGQVATANDLWTFIVDDLTRAGLAAFAEPLHNELLSTGGIILLDGLDEVPEAEARRAQIKAAVEDFAASFTNCRMLITSRTYAYQNQAWQLRNFAAAILAPFTRRQINHFVRQWYAHRAALFLQDSADAQGRATLLERAIFRNERLLVLARQPLLLTLTVSLHAWRGGNLPERREELYEDAVDLLLERWEGQRVVRNAKGEIILMQPSLAEYLYVGREKVLGLLYRLAYEAHARQPDPNGTAEIDEGALVVGLITLTDRADVKPQLLVEYLNNRAGLLTQHGNGRYSFPHRTFQEYLAACHLTGPTFPDEVAELARTQPERWREVLLLAAARATTGTESPVWSLVDALCFRDPEQADYAQADTWGALLAGEALLENADLGHIRQRNVAKVARVRRGLIHVLENSELPARERALAGRALAAVGDTRSEVMTVPHMQFCYIPPGPFLRANRSRHELEVRYAYWISRYPVTNAQYRAFVEADGYGNPTFWHEAIAAGYWSSGTFKGRYDAEMRTAPAPFNHATELPNHPVVGVSWYEAMAFTRWLTLTLQQQYRMDAGMLVRLPKETEWEKAARGGLSIPMQELLVQAAQIVAPLPNGYYPNPQPDRRYPWGDEPESESANCRESGVGITNAVGAFGAGISPYGVEELSGNVWEWLLEQPGDMAGGAFWNDAAEVEIAARFNNHPDFCFHDYGFRCVVVGEGTGRGDEGVTR